MAAQEPGDEFRITDRRRRSEADEAVSKSAEVQPSPAEPPTASAGVPEPPRERRSPRTATGERSLEELFVMLASSAVVALGEAPDPATGQTRRNPAAAAEVIDLLVLLRDKTQGNRSERETELIDGLIYDLQLRFVAATKP